MSRLVDEGYEQSLALLREAATPGGFVASPAFEHYAAVWGRDAAIAVIGAVRSGDDLLVDTSVATVRTLAATQTPSGQVAAVVRPQDGSWDFGEAGAVDVTAWFVIAAASVVRAVGGDRLLAREWWGPVTRAIAWLSAQDVTGTGLVSAAPATDWMDSSLVRFGRTLHLNVLFHWAVMAASELSTVVSEGPPVDAADLRRRIETLFWPDRTVPPEELYRGLGMHIPHPFPHRATAEAFDAAARPDRTHYVSHVVHAHFEERCDVLANLLAVVGGVADPRRAGRVLDLLDREDAAHPVPTRSWLVPVAGHGETHMRIREVERHLDPRWHNPPGAYHNGGAWPFIGGFHALACARIGRYERASALLEEVAAANAEGGTGARWRFSEWFHASTGEASGAPRQTWNAGAYLLAWHATRGS